MAKQPQDENGISPSAKDGEPDAAVTELEAARRRAKETRDRQEEAATGMSDHNGKRGQSIDDQAPPSEDELFPEGFVSGDHKVTMKNIVPAGKGRALESKMSSTAIPMQHGLVPYGRLVELLVTVEAGTVKEVPTLEEQDAGGERKLLGVKDVQTFRPVHVRSAEGLLTVDQVLDILEREFGLPRSADKVRKVFGLDQPRAAAAG